jgi:tetratricopeptide (TPR) repeat protein
MKEEHKYIWLPILTGLVVILIANPISTAAYNLWPSLWKFIAIIAYCSLVISLVLYLHNLYYHATFLWIKFYFQYSINNYDDALQTLVKITQKKPEDTFPLLEQANIYIYYTKDFPSAQVALNKAMSLVGERSDILEIQETLFWNWGKWDQVVNTIKKILSISPERVDLRQDLLGAYIYLGEYQLGLDELNELIENLLSAAMSLEAKSQFRSVRRKLWTAVNAQQKAMKLLGDELINLQDSDKIDESVDKHQDLEHHVKVVEEIASTNPKNYSLYKSSANLCFSLGEYQLGVDLINHIAKILKKWINSYERNSLYEIARKELWTLVDFQSEVLELQSKELQRLQGLRLISEYEEQIAETQNLKNPSG